MTSSHTGHCHSVEAAVLEVFVVVVGLVLVLVLPVTGTCIYDNNAMIEIGSYGKECKISYNSKISTIIKIRLVLPKNCYLR